MELIPAARDTPNAFSGPAGATSTKPTPTAPSYQTQLTDFLAAERQAESGGNYTAYNAAGGASGAYQFIQPTWSAWAQKAGYGQYANGPASAAPQNVQDAVAAAMASSYYQSSGDNWKTVAEDWYYPAWAGVAADQNKVPYPQAGNTLTIGQYGQDIVNTMNQLLGSNGGQSNGQNALNSSGQSVLNNAGAQAQTNQAAEGIAASANQGQYQLTLQQLQQQLNNTLAQLGISGQQLGIQGTGLQQQKAYEQGTQGVQGQQLALSKLEEQQSHQQQVQDALSNLAANGVYNTGTYGRAMTPIQEQFQNAMKSLGLQGTQEQLTNTYQNQQLQNALAQLGLSGQELGIQKAEAQQQYEAGQSGATFNMQNTLANLIQQYNTGSQNQTASSLLSSLLGVGYQPNTTPTTGG